MAVADRFLPKPKGRHARGADPITETADPGPVITEAVTGTPAFPPASQSAPRTGYAYGVGPEGMDDMHSGVGNSSASDRQSLMQELWEAYRSCGPAWRSVQAIARTVTAGGLVADFTADDDEGDQTVPDKPQPVRDLEALLEYCNPQQNIRQVIRSFISDLLIFADAYLEVVWVGSRPVAIYNQDSPSTTPRADQHGAVTGYIQVTQFGQHAEFEPRDIIHVSLDSARPSVLGTSPMEAAVESVMIWLFAAGVVKETLKKGLPATFHADFPAAADEPDMRTWVDQHAARNLGPKNIGRPVITKGGVKLTELRTGQFTDALAALKDARDEIVGDFGVPPAEVSIIESGNLGGGTGDSQHRSFMINTCNPIGELVLEALNFSLTMCAYKITDWRLKFKEVDYRDSVVVEAIRDTRVRNGTWTRNRAAADIGEPRCDGGDDPILVDRANLVLWSDIAELSRAGITSKSPPAAPRPGPGPAPGPPDEPDDEEPGSKPAESGPVLPQHVMETYRRRLAEALRVMPDITEMVALDEPALNGHR